ncbi:MAG: site-specific integrase [Devosia sp.]|uniref:tyrosine-type recombinase/integrase n=1 Tax=Devosia sp. TaxID=1871048 RepID=UPI001A02BEB7|nr:site-specific integrase [Devosia sp.]MBF0677836.1 site-specific integrase [Devosia sp.]
MLILDVLNVYARDVAPEHSRPKETASKIARLASWWGDPGMARRKALGPAPVLTGFVSDINAANCNAYLAFVGARRSASRDLEILRAALRHAHEQRILDSVVKVTLPAKSLPRERWLTRSEVAKLVWTAWRGGRTFNGRSGEGDNWHMRRHLARFILLAVYTGSRKQDVLNASFVRHPDHGFIDLERGVWTRKASSKVATKKRQPPIPLPTHLLAHLRRWHRSGQTFAVEFNGRRVENISKAFRALVAECGLDAEVIPHALRHTGVTWAMQNGVALWEASGYFGMSPKVLMDVYGHHHPDYLAGAAASMGRRRRAV